ncbi:MAG TPA: GtrA family protein [Candidatus Angelobacter sp.]|nr:GtrA family protein [Candidatus Angelobacter sp.]
MRPLSKGSLLWQLANRFVRFGLVGVSGMFVDMGVLFLLADPRTLGWGLSVSKLLAAESAILNNFIWNDLWTFGDISVSQIGWKSRATRFAKFNVICLAGIGISILLLNAQVRFLNANVYLANFISIVLTSFWNFWMNLRFGWVKPRIAMCPTKLEM